MTDLKNNLKNVPAFSHPWEKNVNSIWLATSMTLHRNIDKFNFPQRLNTEKQSLVLDLLLSAIKGISIFSSLQAYHADEISPLDKEFLSEHFLIFDPSKDSHGRAYVLASDGGCLLQINSTDHLEIYLVEVKQELEAALGQIVSIERSIEGRLPFAFSHQFGYLTADPCLSGTGLIVQAYLHIPAIVQCGGYHEILTGKHEELLLTSLQGNAEDLVGDVLVLRNRWATGISEESILSFLRNVAVKLVAEEQSLRTRIMTQRDDHIVDHISRAVGVLKHSFTMDTSEALRTLSLLKFGVELGWITGITVEAVNQLFFDCRRAHLARNTDVTLYATSELHKTRALMLQKAMRAVEFV